MGIRRKEKSECRKKERKKCECEERIEGKRQEVKN